MIHHEDLPYDAKAAQGRRRKVEGVGRRRREQTPFPSIAQLGSTWPRVHGTFDTMGVIGLLYDT